MPYCTSCGTQMAGEARFCASCGTPSSVAPVAANAFAAQSSSADPLRAANPSGPIVISAGERRPIGIGGLPHGLYRAQGYVEVFDSMGETRVVGSVSSDLGLILLDSRHKEVGAWELEDVVLIPLAYMPVATAQIGTPASGCYLVGPDVAPGHYRVSPAEGVARVSAVRYTDDFTIIDFRSKDDLTAVETTVLPTDFAFSFDGILEPSVIPAGVYHSGHTYQMCPDFSTLGLEDAAAPTAPIPVKARDTLRAGPDGIPYGFYKTTTGWTLRDSSGTVIANDDFARRPGEESYSFMTVTSRCETITVGPDDGHFISAQWYEHTPVVALGLTSGRYQKNDFLDDPSIIQDGATSRRFTVSPVGAEPAYVATICVTCMVVVNSHTGLPGEELELAVDLLEIEGGMNLVEFRGRLTLRE